MPNFVWTVKDKFGKPLVREVAAGTIEESKSMLLAEGCTDLVLKSDEIMDAANAGFERMQFLGEEVKVTAADRLKHRGKGQRTVMRELWESVTQDKGLYLMLLLLVGYRLYRGDKMWAAVIGLGLVAWPVFRIWVGLPGIYYARLNKAKDWHRWTEVLELVEKSERIRRSHFIKLPAVELARSRVQALAGLGRLPEALEEFQRLENQPGMPSWLYKAHLAGIYDIAKQHDLGVEYTLKAIEEQPTPSMYIDLMNRLLRYKKDTLSARQALAEIEKGTVIIDIAKPHLMRCRGILAYLEGDFGTARQELEGALAGMEATRQLPFRDGSISVLKAYLCCVLARQGEMNAARKRFDEAREYLIATNETELLEECGNMIGVQGVAR